MGIEFLTLDEVLAIHGHLIERYGGSLGVRDVGLLRSAIAMPKATYDAEFLHSTLHEMAAAYLFHLVQNHSFVDGNKRVGVAVAFAFLRLNHARVQATEDEVVELAVGVASGQVSKAEVAVFLQRHTARAAR
jgi:death on curing protein